MNEDDARRRFSAAPVARLATRDQRGNPTVVPICFVVEADTLYSAVDDKPKTTTRLARLANVTARPEVAVLVDNYAEDWTMLWWVRAVGTGREVAEQTERDHAIALLRAKYAQYADHALDGPVLAVDVSSWRGWSATPPA